MRRVLAVLLSICFLPAIHGITHGYHVITDRAGLEAIAQDPDGYYRLGADIDMSGADWEPFAFQGTLDGKGFSVYDLHIASAGEETRQTVDGNFNAYDTQFCGLFSVVENATIRNLTVKNAIIDMKSDTNCFIAGIAGYAANSKILNCSVSGRFQLTLNDGVNIGAGGLVGYMDSCKAKDCEADVELIVADLNAETVSEEFAGGIYATGRGQIRDCNVKTRVWASVHGYVHNGGCIGMAFWLHKPDTYKAYLYDTSSDTEITYFEDSPSKRGYADVYVGENLGKYSRISGNDKLHFEVNKVTTFDTLLLPGAPYEKR